MDITKGLNMDFHESNQPVGTYRWATDWVAESFDSLTTELGNDYVTSLTTAVNSPLVRGFLPVGFIAKQNAVICFFVNTGTSLSEIGVYLESDGTYHPYLQEVTAKLNFSLNWNVRGLSKSNNNGDWVVVFNDRLNSPKILIIDSVGFDITKYYPNYNINQLELFPKSIFSTFTLEIAEGGSLEVAPYIPFIQYERIDGTKSSCFSSGEIIYISKKKTQVFDADDLGVVTNKVINLTFTQDPSWYKVNIGLASLYTTECRIVKSKITTSGDITITLNSFSGEILEGGLDNINILNTSYNKVHTQTAHQGHLYLGNVEKTLFDIPQSLVNTLGVKWVCDFIDPFEEIATKGAIKSFQPNEVYSLLIRFWKDGTVSNWYHLKGREPRVTSNGFKTLDAPEIYQVDNTPEINITPNGIGSEIGLNDPINNDQYNAKLDFTGAKKFHLNDSIDYSTVTNTGDFHLEGEMSYWENENETYNLYFKDSDLNVGASINELHNKNVRHHKFPSKHFLNLAMNKKRFGVSLPVGISGTTTKVELQDKPLYFTKYQPKLGIKLDPSSLSTFNIALGLLGITYDRIEFGNTQRDITNSTVISEDLAHFGTYGNVKGGWDDNTSIPSPYDTDALGFTGGNFNPQAGASFVGDSDANVLGRINGDFFRNSVNQEVMPNRQRIFNPEIFNDNSIDTNLNVSVDFVRHEVLVSNIVGVTNGGNWVTGEVKPIGVFTPISCIYYTEQGGDNFPASMLTFQSGVSQPYNAVGRHFLFLLDFTLSGNVPLDKTHGQMPTWLNDYVIPENGTDTVSVVANKKVVYSRSDFAYPTRYTSQKVSTSEYRAKGDVSTLNSQPLNSVNRIINYGGNNHLHLKFDDLNRTENNIFKLYPNAAVDLKRWETSSLLRFKLALHNGWNSQFFTGYHPAMNYRYVPGVGGAIGGTGLTKYQANSFVTTLMKYNPNIYSSFVNSPINITVKEGDVYYGDVFISEVNYLVNGFNMYDETNSVASDLGENWGGAGINSCNYRFFAHTRQNQSLRKEASESLSIKNSFYPIKPVSYYRFDTSNVIPQGYNLDENWNIKTINHLQSVPFDSYSQFQTKFPYRILQSSPTIKESSLENWTNFPILNYYEIAKEKGIISNLQGYDEQLIIQTINTLLLTKGSTGLKQGDFSIVLGTGNIFDFPPNEIKLGDYLGTQNQDSCLLTPFGYVFYDNERRRVYILDKGEGVKEISLEGVRLFFERYGETTQNDFTSGVSKFYTYYDHKYRRVLFTFVSKIANRHFTLSYYPENKTWSSFHHYKPLIAFNTKNNFYGVNSGMGVVVFNQPVNTSRFLPGNINMTPIIDVTLNTIPVVTKSGIAQGEADALKFIQSFQWNSEVRDGLTENYNVLERETFTEALVRTNKQASKSIALSFLNNLRKFNNEWQFNAFRDAVVRDSNGNPSAGNVVGTVVTDFTVVGNTEVSPIKRFIDTFAVLRLKYTLSGNKRLTLFSVDWLTKKTNK